MIRSLDLRQEFRPMLALAVPVVLAEIGWMAMGVVDTMMVGRVSAEAIGAVSLGRIMFFTISIFGVGLLLGLDTVISQAHGAGQPRECDRYLVHGIYLSLLVAIPVTLSIPLLLPLLDRLGVDQGVMFQTRPYLRAIAWSSFPLMLHTTFRRYLQGLGRVRPVMLALISANLVNVVGNWILIFGHLGMPALGAAGAGWSTLISSCYLALFLAVSVHLRRSEEPGETTRLDWRFDTAPLSRLLRLGLPAALQLTLEVGAFATGTALAGRLNPASLAAHQIALTLASVTYMVPLGVSSAAAVRVGQALGRKDPFGASRAGWAGVFLGGGFMLGAAAVFIAVPGPLVRLFTTERSVLEVGAALLIIAAWFQFCDGLQVTATGALRGAGDTRTPMLWNLVAHWVIGLPAGYWLCFRMDRGVRGLWMGWLLGLTFVGIVVVISWARRSRAILATVRGTGSECTINR